MGQERMNNALILNIFQSEWDDLDLYKITKEFAASDERRSFFGSFWNWTQLHAWFLSEYMFYSHVLYTHLLNTQISLYYNSVFNELHVVLSKG